MKPGDLVTVVDRLTGIASPGVVDQLNPLGFKVTPAFMMSLDRWYDFAAEGVLWVPGHHDAKSPTVNALRVAHALSGLR
ncbi:MAG TPA: hypothetical protein VGY48_15965 [Vicinamibacterales bacterium]|nr:hypothetical protein [Vicinamibacterales bacterium]